MLKNCFQQKIPSNKPLKDKNIINNVLINLRTISSTACLQSFSYEFPDKLPESTKVVICGGGALGASVAYHLAELGWGPDTIVLEQGR